MNSKDQEISKKPVVSDWVGRSMRLTHCDKAGKAYTKAMNHVAPSRKKVTIENYFRLTYGRIVNGQRLSKDSVPIQEGPIKGTKGIGPGSGDMHFYAFKKKPIRSYFWYSPKSESLVYVSHYRFKDYDPLDPVDTEKVRNNFYKYEMQGGR